jgi:hypothetical protein
MGMVGKRHGTTWSDIVLLLGIAACNQEEA